MNAPKPGRSRPPIRRAAKAEDPAQSLARLREAIVGPDRKRIRALEDEPPLTVDTVAGVLPEALAQSSERRERDVAMALEPAVTRVIVETARRRPELYGDALAPTISVAVRRAVTEALSAMLQHLDQVLERSLSLRAMSWRVEALRTGCPFAEVVLLHTLIYRVEQVFLIDTESSLVLLHLIDRDGVGGGQADQVAALLSAIEAFGREAFGPLPPGAHLQKFELGDLSVWVTRDSGLTLAAVVRGSASESLRGELVDALVHVRLACIEEVRRFSGEVRGFEKARPFLEPLLQTERVRPPRRGPFLLATIGALIAALVVTLVLSAHHRRQAEARLEADYVQALAVEPGIVLLHVERVGGRERIVGLRDPRARDPSAVLAERRLSPAELEFTPFLSLDRRLVAAHVDALRSAAGSISAETVEFPLARSDIEPSAAPTLARVAELFRAAVRDARTARVGVCLEVEGHADPSGPEDFNAALAGGRATAVADRLVATGIDPSFVRVRPVVHGAPPLRRFATFHLDIDEADGVRGCAS